VRSLLYRHVKMFEDSEHGYTDITELPKQITEANATTTSVSSIKEALL
jgi:hypothetical protein